MGQGKKPLFVLFFLFIASCGNMIKLPWDSESPPQTTSVPAVESTATYSLALGGVEEGRDELVIYGADGNVRDFGSQTVTFQTSNDNVSLTVRSGFDSFASGSGALIVPKKVGTTTISFLVDDIEDANKYKVIVSPQSLIQILIGEARGQIADEATTKDEHVELTSASPTGNAIGAVVRNRVQLLNANQPLSLFVVDEEAWDLNPPASHWFAVINAEQNGTFQFSPVDPQTASNAIYLASEKRANLTNSSDLAAYDQAVLTAAGIFDNATSDPTNGAFGFRSPSIEEAYCLSDALVKGLTDIPPGCGTTDANYPAFAPVQILVHPSVAFLDDGRPSFVFIRNRSPEEPAVTNAP